MGNQTIKWQSRLIDNVINMGLCVGCGGCVGICPYFDYFDGRVVIMDRCRSDAGRCYKLCPMIEYEKTTLHQEESGYDKNSEIGLFERILISRSSDSMTRKVSQYGGVVSTLLIFALENGYIESAVLTDAGNRMSPAGKEAYNRSDVLNCGGSRYSASGGLAALNMALKAGSKRLGVVGLPCQMEALARMRMIEIDEGVEDRVALKIGLFCTWALDYRRLQEFLKREGVADAVMKYDIPPPPADRFEVRTEKGRVDFPLSDIRPYIQKGCSLCRDLTAEWADISIGAAEGIEGWNTVVIRTRVGAELMDSAVNAGLLETGNLPGKNLKHLKRAALDKLERGKKAKAGI